LSVERRCSDSAITSAFTVEAARFSEMLETLPIAICCKELKHKVNICGKLWEVWFSLQDMLRSWS